MYYCVKAFLAKAVQAYLHSLGRNDIVIDTCSKEELAQPHNAQQSTKKSKDSNNIDSKNADSSNTESISLTIPLEYPKDKNHGHFATPLCFTLTKILRTNPKALADTLQAFFMRYDAESHNVTTFKQMFAKIESLNGYLNISLSPAFLAYMLENALANPKNFAKAENKNITILLEYVSANPTGPLHIGHARGAIFGSALQRIGKQLGYNIIGEYYVNDAGSQIDMLALSVYNSAAKILGFSQKEGEVYKGEYIDSVATEAIAHFGKDFFSAQDCLQRLGIYAKDKMLQEIQNDLASLNICFDYFVSEKELYGRWDSTLESLRQHSALLEKDGAIWLQSSLKGDEKDRVLVRDNNMPTYMAGDIIYHKDKFERGYNHYINIWGADHHGYIARIKASLEFLGFDSNHLEVLLAQMVSLLKDGQPYKMSKRAGNFILIQDVVQDIGADSLKFVFLSKSLDTHLEFDVDVLSKEDSNNPVFYINYANARIHTLLEKSALTKEAIQNADILSFLQLENDAIARDSIQLILQSLTLFHVLQQSYDERALQKLCEYLKSLAKSLHAFYNAHRILNTQHEAQILKILSLVSLSLTTGFSMLGISIKMKM